MQNPWLAVDSDDMEDLVDGYESFYGVFNKHPMIIAEELERPKAPFLGESASRNWVRYVDGPRTLLQSRSKLSSSSPLIIV